MHMGLGRFPSVIVALVSLFLSALVSGQSSVWLAQKDGNSIYLGGTIHVLSAADFPLPPQYDQAYEGSDTLVFELDIDQMNDPTTQGQLMTAMMYSDGRTLSSVLSAETYELLAQHLAERGVPIVAMNGFSAGGVSLFLTVMELQALGFAEEGVDHYYYAKAGEEGKARAYLETLEEQIGFIKVLGEGIEEEVILHSLTDLEQLPILVDEMMAQWRTGDLAGMDASMLQDFRTDFPVAYESIILNRNRSWVGRIEEMIQTDEIEFILVGGAHMAGPDGLIAELESLGYEIAQL